MTDRELMQQALEALTEYDGTNGESKRKRVLAALRERLAEPDYWQEEARRYAGNADYWRDKYNALAQPEQEPFCYHDGRNIVGKEYAHHCDVFPLYTEPQPEQEPLTDEEIDVLILDSDGLPKSHLEFARDIEAAHGITGDANEN